MQKEYVVANQRQPIARHHDLQPARSPQRPIQLMIRLPDQPILQAQLLVVLLHQGRGLCKEQVPRSHLLKVARS